MSGIVDDRKMSDTEALMWRLEGERHMSSTFANLTILDRAPDVDLLKRRMEQVAVRVPRLRQVVREVPGNVGLPTWVDDPDFDVGTHIRRIALPPPGNHRQLLDLARLAVLDPFDRSRPLWQFIVVEGLADGRAALIEKLHHTIADGERGVALALEFLDLERDAPPPPAPTADEVASIEPDFVEDASAVVVRDVLAGALRIPLGVTERVRELLADPAALQAASDSAIDTLRSFGELLSSADPARSPLWTDRSGRRHVEVTSAPFDVTRDVAKRLGGTVNTAFVALAAEAAARYHAEFGTPVDELRASMAVSTRGEASGANAFSLVRMLVPTAEMGIEDRFEQVRLATQEVTGDASTPTLDSLAALTSPLPTAIVSRLARQQAGTVDFATSNVRGAPVPLYVAGAKLLHNHPIGPLTGVAFNITVLSYLEHLDMGLNIDPAAVADPAALLRHLDGAITSFLAVGG